MIYMDSSKRIKRKRSKEVDFVFVYEVKNRELQGITLIGYELIKRGYTVGYVNTWHGLHHDDIRYRAKVAVVFEAYNTDVIGFALSFIEHCDNVLNMQWEQILNDACLDENSLYILRGDATRVFHASWGKKNKEHLVNICHIPEDKIRIVGHIGLDFVSNKFKGFYKSKESICEEYRFNPDKSMVVFISSFAPPNLLEEELGLVSIKSKKVISEWLIRYAKENPMMIVIYRPHPTEILADDVYNAMKRNGIRIISDYSVQQWIMVADILLNWWSTSLADIYAAGKKCVFLRPYKMPNKDEYHMFKNIKMATNYEEMLDQIKSGFPNISSETFNDYYYIDKYEPAYIRLANLLEEISESTSIYMYDNKNIIKLKEKSIIIEMREIYGLLKAYIQYKFGRENSRDEIRYHLLMSKKQYVSEKKIVDLMQRIGIYT